MLKSCLDPVHWWIPNDVDDTEVAGARFPTKANATYPHTSSFSSGGRGSPTQILKTFLILDTRVIWVICLLASKRAYNIWQLQPPLLMVHVFLSEQYKAQCRQNISDPHLFAPSSRSERRKIVRGAGRCLGPPIPNPKTLWKPVRKWVRWYSHVNLIFYCRTKL